MFHFSKFHLFAPLALLILAACGSNPGSARAQDLGGSFLRPRDDFVSRAQLPTRPLRQFSAADPARILVIGDSLAQGFGIFLDRRVKARDLAAVVTNKGRTSTGLSRSDFYDWPREFAAQAAALRPDIVVVHFGSNDNQSVVLPGGNVRRSSDGWDEAYRAQVQRILETAAEQQVMVYWLGPAPDRGASLNRHITRINPIFQAESAAVQATYLPLSAFAAGPNGEFVKNAPVNGRVMTIRSGDGSHYTAAGYNLVVDTLLERMQTQIPAIFDATTLELAGVLQ